MFTRVYSCLKCLWWCAWEKYGFAGELWKRGKVFLGRAIGCLLAKLGSTSAAVYVITEHMNQQGYERPRQLPVYRTFQYSLHKLNFGLVVLLSSSNKAPPAMAHWRARLVDPPSSRRWHTSALTAIKAELYDTMYLRRWQWDPAPHFIVSDVRMPLDEVLECTTSARMVRTRHVSFSIWYYSRFRSMFEA